MILDGRVVREPDLRSTGRRFESRSPGRRMQPWASCLHTCASVTKHYNLVLANGRWYSAAEELTAGLAESILAAYRRVYGFAHLRADCRGPGSAPESYARFEYGTTRSIVLFDFLQRLLIVIACRHSSTATISIIRKVRLPGRFRWQPAGNRCTSSTAFPTGSTKVTDQDSHLYDFPHPRTRYY